MCLFLAFFLEYLEKMKEKERMSSWPIEPINFIQSDLTEALSSFSIILHLISYIKKIVYMAFVYERIGLIG